MRCSVCNGPAVLAAGPRLFCTGCGRKHLAAHVAKLAVKQALTDPPSFTD